MGREWDVRDQLSNFAFGAKQVSKDMLAPNVENIATWQAVLITVKESGETSEEGLPLKTCDDASFSQFYPSKASSEARIADLKKTRAFMCIDLDEYDQLKLYGNYDSDESQRIELRLLPCNTSSSPSCILPLSKNDTLSPED